MNTNLHLTTAEKEAIDRGATLLLFFPWSAPRLPKVGEVRACDSFTTGELLGLSLRATAGPIETTIGQLTREQADAVTGIENATLDDMINFCEIICPDWKRKSPVLVLAVEKVEG